MRRLLFVCTGNTCRSPVAEHLFRILADEANLAATASSAGVEAVPGAPLSRGAEAVFAARGIGPVPHRARRVDAASVSGADAVYVMERAHLDELILRFPESSAKISTLRNSDVADPVGSTAAVYEDCAASIEQALRIIVSREKENAPNPR